MWALLDIRTGRANRAQFILLIVLCIAIRIPTSVYFPIIRPSGIHVDFAALLSNPGFYIHLLIYYIFYLAVFRRCRDRGSQKVAFFMLAYTVFWVLPLLIPPLFSVYAIVGYFLIMSGFSKVLSVIVAIVSIIFIVYLLMRGDPAPNQYGYPPIRLKFSTMTMATYPKRLLAQQREMMNRQDSERAAREEEEVKAREAFYRDNLKNRQTETQETLEFKDTA